MRTDRISTLLLLIFLSVPVLAMAGSLDAPAAPAVGSGMPTTTDIFNRLDTGATSSVPGSFQDPAAGPTVGTGKSLSDIEGRLPVLDDTNGATTSDVAAGKTFWGLRSDGTWGVKTGVGDSNLISGNIKSGVSIFGVTGDQNIVDTSSGDATRLDIAFGKKAWVDGVEITGGSVCSGSIYNAVAGGTRWCDNGDGTITDMQSGLIWMQNSSGPSIKFNWSIALFTCAQEQAGSSGLSDGSVIGDWRLPNKFELNDLQTGIEVVSFATPGPFLNIAIPNADYWSSTTYAYMTTSAWFVNFNNAIFTYIDKTNNFYVRCVR